MFNLTSLQKYILKRVGYSAITIFFIVFAVFTLGRLAGDPLEAYIDPLNTEPEVMEFIRQKYHLDEPIPIQFIYWVQGIMRGDWGRAFSHGEAAVKDLIIQYAPLTLELNLYTLIIAIPGGYWIGTKAAANKDTWIDHLARFFGIIGHALPSFFIGLLLLAFLYPKGLISVYPEWTFTSITGMPTIDALLNRDFNGFIQAFKYLLGPLLTSIFGSFASNSRILRSSILEELGKEYITTGRSKGLSKDYIDKKYARRNALLAYTTMTGYWFAGLLSGTAVLEAVFNRRGMGNIAAAAARATDHNTLQAFTLIYAIFLVSVNLIVDLLYGFIDPRIKYGENK